MKKLNIFVLLLLTCSLAYASEVMIPATQISLGSGSLNLYYSKLNKDINFTISSVDQIQVAGTDLSYFSQTKNDLECPLESNIIALKFVTNPSEGFNYWIKVGAGTYNLEIPSATVKNKLAGQDNGFIVGIGLRSQIFPDTIVSPGLAVGIGVDYSLYNVDKFKSGDSAEQLINNRLELTQIQIEFLISKELKKFDIYGGLKVFRDYITLRDKTALQKVSGNKDNVCIFLGARLKIHDKEALVIEGSAIGETGFSAGWSIEF